MAEILASGAALKVQQSLRCYTVNPLNGEPIYEVWAYDMQEAEKIVVQRKAVEMKIYPSTGATIIPKRE